MALPIIVSKTAVPPEIHECETSTITIVARDPTVTGDVTLQLRVANGLGEVTPDTVVVRLAGGGPLVYTCVLAEGEKGQVLSDPTRPGVFIYVAPCPDDPNHDPTTHDTLPVPHPH
jgi:hypothetical protein